MSAKNKTGQSLSAPPFLQKGAVVGVTCPASKIDEEAAGYGCKILRSWGFKVKKGSTLNGHFHNFSAPDEIRRKELQEMLDDESIEAIVFGRGGYGILRILDKLDFSKFIKSPKWLCGYSDITALHLHVAENYGIQTIHSVMCSGITKETGRDKYVGSLRNILTGKPIDYIFNTNQLNREGNVRASLIGGNLCLLTALCGSVSQPDMTNKILFIEDVGEYKYSIDRMMLTLKRAGLLDNLAGLIVGSFTHLQDTDEPFGQTINELIYDKVKDYDYPLVFNFPVGHQKENVALKQGAVYQFRAGHECRLKEWVI